MKRSALPVVVVLAFVAILAWLFYANGPMTPAATGTLTVVRQPVIYEGASLSCLTTSGTTQTVTYWMPGGYTSNILVTPNLTMTAFATTTTSTAMDLSAIALTTSPPPQC